MQYVYKNTHTCTHAFRLAGTNNFSKILLHFHLYYQHVEIFEYLLNIFVCGCTVCLFWSVAVVFFSKVNLSLFFMNTQYNSTYTMQ